MSTRTQHLLQGIVWPKKHLPTTSEHARIRNEILKNIFRISNESPAKKIIRAVQNRIDQRKFLKMAQSPIKVEFF